MGIISNGNKVYDEGGLHVGNTDSIRNIETGFHRRLYLGYMDNYYQGVIPLVNLTNSPIYRYSYASGRIEIIRHNGVAWFGNAYVDFKMQKNYNSTGYHWTESHRNSGNITRCTFTWNGEKWGGLKIAAPTIHAHTAWFNGSGYEEGGLQIGDDSAGQWYIPIYRTDTSTVLNSEIYNSLTNDG